MKLKLTKHFQDRMQDRRLNFDHVRQALREPDKQGKAYNNVIRVIKTVDNGKTIEVLYCKEAFRDKKDEYLLITAYYLD